MEAITDTEAGLANLMAAPTRPLGWTGSQGASAEVGDLCWHYFQNDHGPMNGYTVQQIWSNEANGCVYEIPICDGTNATLCRKCNQYDDGLACGGAKPACALNGPNGGKCVACTPTYTKGCTGATTVCDATTDTCVQCLENGDCKATAPVCNTTTKTCRGCESDAECATGTYCDVGADTSKGQCVACNLDAQCPAGDECSLDTHTCKPKPPPQPEGGAGDDGGNGDSGGGSGGSNGCGCTVAGGDGSTVWLLGAAVGAAALARVRRRR
jgi:MYXO-CTERM domain-containing protein